MGTPLLERQLGSDRGCLLSTACSRLCSVPLHCTMVSPRELQLPARAEGVPGALPQRVARDHRPAAQDCAAGAVATPHLGTCA